MNKNKNNKHSGYMGIGYLLMDGIMYLKCNSNKKDVLFWRVFVISHPFVKCYEIVYLSMMHRRKYGQVDLETKRRLPKAGNVAD